MNFRFASTNLAFGVDVGVPDTAVAAAAAVIAFDATAAFAVAVPLMLHGCHLNC